MMAMIGLFMLGIRAAAMIFIFLFEDEIRTPPEKIGKLIVMGLYVVGIIGLWPLVMA